jgi:putative zinc finger/helix-turn-helix YgiT family protein
MNEQPDAKDDVGNQAVRCGQCGSAHLVASTHDDAFTYGTGTDAVELSVPVPVYSCQQCGFVFTTDAAEVLRHEAICRHLGVLTPAEIRQIRAQANLTRDRFAALTGIGTASLSRWETGELIQSAGYDKYLRLLESPDNLRQLRHLAARHADESSGLRAAVSRRAGAFKALEAAGRFEVSTLAASIFSLRVIASDRVH